MNLQEAVKEIRPLDEKAMEQAREHWDSIAHPLHSLGKLEDMVVSKSPCRKKSTGSHVRR